MFHKKLNISIVFIFNSVIFFSDDKLALQRFDRQEKYYVISLWTITIGHDKDLWTFTDFVKY
jgi:hypothetical protein